MVSALYLLGAALAFTLSTHAYVKVAEHYANSCSSFKVSSDDIYTHYKFYDFRGLQAEPVPDPSYSLPQSANYETGEPGARVGTVQSGFLKSKDFTSEWGIQNWGKGVNENTAYPLWNSYSNIYIDRNKDGNKNATSKLVLKTERTKDFQSSGEMENL